MKIKITIIIDDQELVEEYEYADPQLILDDFENEASAWFPGSDMKAEIIY